MELYSGLTHTLHLTLTLKYPSCISLGGIITWDILSHQRTPANDKEKADYAKLDIIYPKLDFKPDYFFALGSPIGAILVFRNQNPALYRPDDSIIFENIFHPFDPLAYRFEPLLHDQYTDEAAVLIERSVPIGPTFSLPSLPSFPGSSLLSLFPRSSLLSLFPLFSFSSSTANDDAKTSQQILEASEEAVTDNTQSSTFWKWFMAYFVGQQKHSQNGDRKPSEDNEEGSKDAREHADAKKDGQIYLANDNDLTSFDGFDGPRVIDCTNNDEDVFDEEASTKWAGGVLIGKYDFTGRLKPRRLGSRLNRDGILTSGVVTAPIMSDKTDYFSLENQKASTKHTVDVLSNDGRRVDSLKRAREAHKNSRNILSQLSQDLDSPLSPNAQQEFWSQLDADTMKIPHLKMDEETLSMDTSKDDSKSEISRNSNNVLDDLNKELHEPGAKIMEPRQSSESITRDATVPKYADHDHKSMGSSEEGPAVDLLPRRIDYVLQPESFMDMLTNEYIVGFRAHFSYWTSKDLQWHILGRLEDLDSIINTPDKNSVCVESS